MFKTQNNQPTTLNKQLEMIELDGHELRNVVGGNVRAVVVGYVSKTYDNTEALQDDSEKEIRTLAQDSLDFTMGAEETFMG